VPKKLQKNFFTFIFFLRLCDRYTCKFWWDDRQRASGYLKKKSKIVRSQKNYFYWDISLEIRMFTLYISNIFVPVPSGPPQNINCQSRSPNSILLEWSKPKREERNGIIRGYWLQYYPRTLWYGKSTVMTTHSDNRTVSPYYGCHHVRGFSDPTRYVSELATYVPSHCHLLCVHVLSIYVASEMTNSNLFQKIQNFPKNPKFSKKSKNFQKI
jgi:hypothetical protein